MAQAAKKLNQAKSWCKHFPCSCCPRHHLEAWRWWPYNDNASVFLPYVGWITSSLVPLWQCMIYSYSSKIYVLRRRSTFCPCEYKLKYGWWRISEHSLSLFLFLLKSIGAECMLAYSIENARHSHRMMQGKSRIATAATHIPIHPSIQDHSTSTYTSTREPTATYIYSVHPSMHPHVNVFFLCICIMCIQLFRLPWTQM